jgi:hypothetical protein
MYADCKRTDAVSATPASWIYMASFGSQRTPRLLLSSFAFAVVISAAGAVSAAAAAAVVAAGAPIGAARHIILLMFYA